MPHASFRERSTDQTDGVERHVWGEQQYLKNAGSVIKVNGTDTGDEEAPVINNGSSFHLKKDSNTEVFLLSGSSDTTQKLAVLSIPRDKQRRWMEGSGGIQNPTDPENALDISGTLAHVTKNKFAVGEKGEFEVKGAEAYARVDKLIVTGELIVNKQIRTPLVIQGKEDPPGFQGSKQAEVTGETAPTQLAFDFNRVVSAQLAFAFHARS
jgi:hypothetical protein